MNCWQKKSTGRIAQAACTLGLLFAGLSLCTAQGRNQSRLEVQLSVKNGYLAVDREASRCKPGASRFTPSDDFKRLLGVPRAAADQCFPQIEQKLFDDLDSAFAQLPPFYWFALSNPERDADKVGQLNDALSQSVRKATDT